MNQRAGDTDRLEAVVADLELRQQGTQGAVVRIVSIGSRKDRSFRAGSVASRLWGAVVPVATRAHSRHLADTRQVGARSQLVQRVARNAHKDVAQSQRGGSQTVAERVQAR